MAKSYLYKTYRPSRVTVNQRVYDGDFEGVLDDNFNTYWSAVGSPTFAGRNRNEAYPAQTIGTCFELDGVGNYIQLPTFGLAGTSTPEIIITNDFTIVMGWYKANWNDGRTEHFLFNQDSIIGNTGIALSANVSAGNMQAEVYIGSTNRTCTYPLSSISAGLHSIGIQASGGNVYLLIDGVRVASNLLGAGGTVNSNGFTPLLVGSKRTISGGAYVYSNYATGKVDSITIYSAALTVAQLDQIWHTQHPTTTNIKAHWDFDKGSGDFDASTVNTHGASIIGGVASGWGTGFAGISRSVMVRTATAGSAEQGIRQASSKESNITGGANYIAHARVMAAVGEQITLRVNPIGGGTASETTIVATGVWQTMQLPYTTNAAATKIWVEIVLENANASIKELYIDQAAINDGSTAYDYFDYTTASVGNTVYGFNDDLDINTGTFTTFTYIGTWNDVADEGVFEYEQEINNAGSQVTVVLARDPENFNERGDVDFDLEVRVYCIDDDTPNGQLIFTGYIADYKPDEVENKVTVIIFSYGAELDGFMVESGEFEYAILPIYSTTKTSLFWGNHFALAILPTENITIKKIALKLAMPSGSQSHSLQIYRGDPLLDSIVTTGGIFSLTLGGTNVQVASSASKTITGATPTRYEFEFATEITLQAGQSYYIASTQDVGGAITYAGGGSGDAVAALSFPPLHKLYYGRIAANNSGASILYDSAFPCIYCEVIEPTGSTTAAYSSQDPSAILRSVLDDYSRQGGEIAYDAASILDTGTKVSYTFKSVSTYEAIKKCLELAPADWYFYIDHATKKLHFKQKADEADHKFILGVHFKALAFEKRSEDIVNTIYFTGGADDSGKNLFKKYQDAASVSLYGQKLLKYVDNRVTNIATADIIADAIISKRKFPEVRVSLSILDSYNIEAIKPGQVVTFRNIGNNADYDSMWDTGFWDQAYWDFDAANPATYDLQIARLHYLPDAATMTLSTTPPDVNKRIEDIKRNLDAQQTINNPSTPETA